MTELQKKSLNHVHEMLANLFTRLSDIGVPGYVFKNIIDEVDTDSNRLNRLAQLTNADNEKLYDAKSVVTEIQQWVKTIIDNK